MTAATKPSSRYRWIDRQGHETFELRQLRTLRRLGLRMSELAAQFGLSEASMRSLCHRYAVRSPRSVLPGQAGSYRAAGPLDQAQPAEVADPTDQPAQPEAMTDELWECFNAWLDERESTRAHFREQALAKREEAAASD
jgi:hypothetical protein